MISNSSELCMILSATISICLPIILIIVLKQKYKISLFAVGMGAIIFFAFAMILEQALHYFVLVRTGISQAPQKHAAFYVVYGILAAGVFEETGRFIAYKLPLKKFHEWKDGLAYGLGHGGLESIMIGGLAGIQMVANAILINGGYVKITNGTSAQAQAINQLIKSYSSSPSYIFLLPGLERMFAFTIQLALSIFLFYGIKNRKNIYLLFAILLHALVDLPAAMSQVGLFGSGSTVSVAIEVVYFVEAILALVFVVKSRKLFKEEKAGEEAVEEEQ